MEEEKAVRVSYCMHGFEWVGGRRNELFGKVGGWVGGTYRSMPLSSKEMG